MGRLLKSALEFNNNWIDKKENVEVNQKLSIVIPVYYPKYLKEVLEHLSKLEGIYEVITVFDYVEKDLNQYIEKIILNKDIINKMEECSKGISLENVEERIYKEIKELM